MLAANRLIALLLSCFASSLAAQELAWQTSLASALLSAQEQQRVMLVAIVMPGERDSDAVIAHYRDADVRKLSSNCVCLRIDIDASRPSNDERDVLQQYVGAAPRDPIAIPHHLIVHPDGKTVLSSAADRMTAGQLEWFLADGIQKLDPSFPWQLGERARAPEGLLYGEAKKTREAVRPPSSKADVKKAIDDLKKGGARNMRAIEQYQVLVHSDESAAVKYVEQQMRGGLNMLAGPALAAISESSPVAWSSVLVDFLDNRKPELRTEAARGLAQMAHAKTYGAIKKALKNEKEPQIKARLLRAAAATGPSNKSTIAALEDALADEKDATVRMHAAVAAGCVEVRSAARQLLRKALADKDPDVRSAAAYAIACRRDHELAGSIEATIEHEPDAEAKHWLELALDTILKKRDLRGFENFRSKVLKDTRDRNGSNANAQAGQQAGGK
jgi:hypothetical protein